MENKIILCGLGPHAMKYHYNILEQLQEEHNVSIELLVDLKSGRDRIRRFLKTKRLQPKRMVFLEDTAANICGERLDEEAEKIMEELNQSGLVNKMFVSTEPKSHKIYTIWALKHNLDVILDKPLTAPIMDAFRPAESKRIMEDFLEIREYEKNSKGRMYVMLPKRHRKNYSILRDVSKKFVSDWKVPITFIGIQVCEGMWNMPNEFFTRENHPYKYGYGGFLHSGYHYTDIILWLLECNECYDKFSPDKLEITSMTTSPYDFIHQVDHEFYIGHFNQDYSQYVTGDNLERLRRMGELDSFTQIRAKHGDAVITNINMSLIHTSYSARSWTKLPEDTYTQNGRINHQDVCIQFGNLFSMNAYTRSVPHKVPREQEESRTKGDFVIEIYRNVNMIGGKAYEKVVYKNEVGENKQSIAGRRIEIEEWLKGEESMCEFQLHWKNVMLLQKLYECRFLHNLKKPPYVELSFK